MTDVCFETASRPQVRNFRSDEEVEGKNSVRAYRSSPEDVTVQICGETRWASVGLSFEEARRFAQAILEACDG